MGQKQKQKRKGQRTVPRIPRGGAPSPDAPSTMGAGEFKNRCLAVLDEVAATRRPVVITKRGVPVARVIPERQAAAEDFFGDLARRGWRLAPGVDLVQPIISAAEWAEMDREHEALMPGDSAR